MTHASDDDGGKTVGGILKDFSVRAGTARIVFFFEIRLFDRNSPA